MKNILVINLHNKKMYKLWLIVRMIVEPKKTNYVKTF
jgi:hypothetical protein